MSWRVTLFDIDLDQAEIDAVTAVLSSRWISMGAVTQKFEQEFASSLDVPEAVAVSSGTAALHVAVMALGLEPGSDVIMPSLSFVASAATVILAGACPVFAEVKGPHDLTIDPADVARKITSKTRAIIVMHYGGYAADMEALLALARRYGLAIIEDAAHAPVVRYGSGMLGTLGDIGCFSFFATKNMTTGEGGMVVARDPVLLRKARSLRSHCMTTTSWDKHHGRSSAYDVDGLGLNYRISDIASSIGRVQLRKLATDRRRRVKIAAMYRAALSDLPHVVLPFADRYHDDSAHHLFPLILPSAQQRPYFQEQLKLAGIQSSVHYPPMHLFSYYRQHYHYQDGSLPITEDIATRVVSMPMHACLTQEQVDWVITCTRQLLEK